MHELRDVHELVVDRFDDRSLPQHNLVVVRHELVLHVGPQPCDDVDVVGEKPVEKRLGHVPLVRVKLSYDVVAQPVEHLLVPVVHVSPCEDEVQDLATLVADDVELEAVEPSHRALAPLGISLEHLVAPDPLVVAYRHACAVDEAYARALAEAAELEEEHHLYGHPCLKFHEPVVRHRV